MAILAGAACLMSSLAVSTAGGQDQSSDSEAIPTFGTTVVIPSGLTGYLYYLQPETTRLPDFDKIVPVATVYTNRLNVPERDFVEGFPGLSHRVEWFAIDYFGRFWAETPGKYKFSLLSDDGSRLYIDDRLEIDNDGIHAPVLISSRVNLTRGIHKIRVSYFQGPRFSVALVLSVAPPGEKWKIFNTNDFRPPSNTAGWDPTDVKALEDAQEEPLHKPFKSPKEIALENTAVERLKQDDPPHDFDLRAAALQFPAGGKDKTDLTIAYEVPLSNLKSQVDELAETRTWRFVLLALIRDQTGKVVKDFRLDIPFAVPEAQTKSITGRHFTYARNFRLGIGKYRVAMGVLDLESRKAGAFTTEVGDAGEAGVQLSSLIMVDHVQKGSTSDGSDPLVYQGQRLVPMLSRVFPSGEQRMIFLVARADGSTRDKPALEMELIAEGASIAKQSSPMPDANEAGLIPVSFVAPGRAGKCELRVTAVQGQSRVVRSITYEIQPGH